MTGEEAYERYAHDLTAFATALVGPSDAPDVVAESLIRCVYGRTWNAVRDHRAYLHRAVLSEARRHRLSGRRRRSREVRVAPRERVADPETDVDVLGAVRQLSMRQRAVVYLTYWDDLAPQDVSELLGIGEGSVKRHLARARARLRGLLGE